MDWFGIKKRKAERDRRARLRQAALDAAIESGGRHVNIDRPARDGSGLPQFARPSRLRGDLARNRPRPEAGASSDYTGFSPQNPGMFVNHNHAAWAQPQSETSARDHDSFGPAGSGLPASFGGGGSHSSSDYGSSSSSSDSGSSPSSSD